MDLPTRGEAEPTTASKKRTRPESRSCKCSLASGSRPAGGLQVEHVGGPADEPQSISAPQTDGRRHRSDDPTLRFTVDLNQEHPLQVPQPGILDGDAVAAAPPPPPARRARTPARHPPGRTGPACGRAGVTGASRRSIARPTRATGRPILVISKNPIGS